MENTNQYTAEELQKCPFHQSQNTTANNKPHEHTNTGDWGDLDEEDHAGTDPDRNEDEGNSTDATSSGNAATNS